MDAQGLLNALLAEYADTMYAWRNEAKERRLPSAEDLLIHAAMVTRRCSLYAAQCYVAEELQERYASHAE